MFGFGRGKANGHERLEFENLVREHRKAIYSSSLRLTRDPDEAEDLMQEALLRAFRAFHQFRKGTNFKAWILKIVLNTYINSYRKQKRAPAIDSMDGENFDQERSAVMADTSSPEQLAMDARLSEEMKAAIDSLPEQFRTTLWLCEVEGLSYEEAADVMKVPLGTVRSRLSRARTMMKEKLEASKTYAK